ncbi:MAG: phenylalanine--tRNA ligase beta subunit-related protein [bacterium]
MKIAIQTINKFLKKSLSTSDIVDTLSRTEIEVEEILYSKELDSKIILVKILDVFPHPNADRLRLVTIDTGSSKPTVVCGAPNLVVGMRVAWVQPGSVLPDGNRIEAAVIRGEKSAGMLASAEELGISDDHTGILEFETDSHPLGTSLCDIVFSYDALDIKTPANRWDFLSGEGIGREIAAYVDSNQFIPVEVGDYTYKTSEFVKVKAREVNQRFVSVRMSLKNDVKTPSMIVDNLLANGFVSHNPAVDITNYVMLEIGQPAHAYDAQKLVGPLTVRFAKSGEQITTLDEVQRTLTSQDLVVCDDRGPVGLAGIMGSAHTQIDAQTTEIVLEAAHWDKTLIRRTAIRQGIRTEASTRFERGLPLQASLRAMSRMIDLIKLHCQGKIIDGPYDQLHGWPWEQFLGVRLRRSEAVLGMKLEESKMVTGLRKLGFGVTHFSITQELKQHLGKPYKWGANYRVDRETAFDCSYLIDRFYSKLGKSVGHTALGQFHNGNEVPSGEKLRPGDVLFIKGQIIHSATDHYYITGADGKKIKQKLSENESVGHNGIYIGNDQVIHAATYKYRRGSWVKRKNSGVIVSPVAEFTKDPGYLGARRYVTSMNHILAIEVPWWRPDIRNESDMIEELGKLAGYDQLPETLPTLPPMSRSDQSIQLAIMELRKRLVYAGSTEISTYSFISAEDVTATSIPLKKVLKVANPRSPEQAYLRTSMLASHAHFWSRQGQATLPAGVFELSRVFESRGNVEQPIEIWKLAFSAYGHGAAQLVQSALHDMAVLYHVDVNFKPSVKSANLIPNRSATILSQKSRIGDIGQLKSAVGGRFGLKNEMAWFEIDVSVFLAAQSSIELKLPPDYQLVMRDVTFEVPQTVWWQDIAQLLKPVDQLWSFEFLRSFQSPEMLIKGRHSITVRLLLDLGAQPSSGKIEKTLNLIQALIRT